MDTKIASKYALKFLTIGKNWPVFLLAVFLLTGCPGGDGSEGTAPAIPANPDAVGGDQRVTVTWESSAGVSSYNVYWSTTSGIGTGGTLENVAASPFYHDGVTNAQPYYYVVTAVNDAGESGSSREVTATPVDILLSGLLFADANLQACFNAWLGSNLELTYVHNLTGLSCNSSSIADITGIEALTSLTGLALNGNNDIIDVSPLESLTNLSTLILNSSITNVSALAQLTGLMYLDLADNGTIIDVSALASLTNLKYLYLTSNKITNVSALASLTNLTYLYLANNTITDVSALKSLTSLEQLYLNNNSIGGQDVGNVDDLVSLVNASRIGLQVNTSMSCSELTTLIDALNTDMATVVLPTPAVAEGADKNCTNPPLI